jgi:hypothetical protein
MDRFTLPQNAAESFEGDFIDIAAVESLLANQKVLTRAKEEFQGTLRILQNREQLTVATLLNLADSTSREICEPSLVGRCYELATQDIKPCPDGLLARVRDAEHVRDACVSLFDECEALQDAVRSEMHKIHNEYVFVHREAVARTPADGCVEASGIADRVVS